MHGQSIFMIATIWLLLKQVFTEAKNLVFILKNLGTTIIILLWLKLFQQRPITLIGNKTTVGPQERWSKKMYGNVWRNTGIPSWIALSLGFRIICHKVTLYVNIQRNMNSTWTSRQNLNPCSHLKYRARLNVIPAAEDMVTVQQCMKGG